MEYIGTVKNGYMFTNKLNGISKGDIIYQYTPKQCTYSSEYGIGRPRITAKYSVVYYWDLQDENCDLMNYQYDEAIKLGYTNERYIIKCELIEKVDYELKDFVSWRKNQDIIDNRMNYSFCSQCPAFYDSGSYYTPNYECGSMDDTGTCLKAKLTRYNGLTRCIKIGDE